jgi:hypothetical protein
MRRRVGSASAANVRFSNRGEHLTIWLSISQIEVRCKKNFIPFEIFRVRAKFPKYWSEFTFWLLKGNYETQSIGSLARRFEKRQRRHLH